MTAETFFSTSDLADLEKAIGHAEQNTSGEIRVHLENTCIGEVLDRAAYVFSALKMHRTQHRNGVLIYVAVDDQKFAIIGDVGIHQKTGNHFWDEIRDLLQTYFHEKKFIEGLKHSIELTGEKLKLFFPYQHGDINELPNEVTTGHRMKHRHSKAHR